MKWLGYKRVQVKSIRCDVADLRKRMKAEHVIALAADIKAAGSEPIHAPTIQDGSKQLLCGRDRLSASMLNKAKTIWVHLADCDDKEAKQLELRENIYRRAISNRAAMLSELVSLQKQQIRAAEEQSSRDTVPPSRAPKSEQAVTSEARKQVARAAGVTPAAVRKAEQRAKEESPVSPSMAFPLPVGFNSFDLGVPDEFERQSIVLLAEHLEIWAQSTVKILTDLAGVDKSNGLARRHIDRIRETVQAAGHAIRDAIPASLCFYCKGHPPDGECHPCDGLGFVGRHGGDNVPAELKERGADAMVAVNGRFVPFGSKPDAAPAPAPKKERRITVVMEDEAGNQTPVDLDDSDELAF